MTKAIISQPDKTAMQSGKAKTHAWLLEIQQDAPNAPDTLMGWNSMTDTKQELNLRFPTLEAAIAYATRNGLEFEVAAPHARTHAPKAYADNFRFNKVSG